MKKDKMAAILLHIQDQERNHLRRNRVFRDRTNPLDAFDDVEIKSRYRLTRQLIMDLYDLIGAELEPATMRNHAIPGMIQIFIALRYYATNSYFSLVGDSIGIHKCSVSRIVNRVTRRICRLSNTFIKLPTGDDIAVTKRKFHNIAHMPQVIGAIDGTLIAIIKPHDRDNLYVSRLKRGHALNVLATCNADLLLTNVVAKYPGSSNDSYIWNNSNLRGLFQEGRFGDAYLLGDSGFGLSPHLLTPVMNAEENSAEERYNTSHRRTRQVIERCFALLKGRFRCLHKDTGKLKFNPAKCCRVIIACCVLHNMCVINRLPEEDIDLDENDDNDDENEHLMPAADDVNEARRARAAGNVVRGRIIQRFA